MSDELRSKLWLERNYEISLRQLIGDDNEENQKEQMMKIKSKRFGEITVPDRNNQSLVYSDQFGLFNSRS